MWEAKNKIPMLMAKFKKNIKGNIDEIRNKQKKSYQKR